ncbi:MAG: serine/threonine protein kinase [Polyangiaceae bacterium]|nr:serine/threonine protein kinase [Polyangiaceae bacterium]
MLSPPADQTPPTDPGAPVLLDVARVDLPVGHVLAERYEVLERVGAGGMGTVYRVFDRALSEEVALKVLRPELAGDPRAIERFVREVKLARKIAHPNVCRIFDLGTADGIAFLTMELLGGESLRRRITRGVDPPGERLRLLVEIARGLSAVHAEGILHRDLKPENVLVRGDGTAVVSDFGLAILPNEASGSTLTAGTPLYMSPEQLRGEPVTVKSDIFALGLVGFELLTGERPFGNGPPAVVTSAILRDPPKTPQFSGLGERESNALAEILSRALAKNADDRWPGAGEFVSAVSQLALSHSETTATAGKAPDSVIAKTQTSHPAQSTHAVRRRSVSVGGVTLVGVIAVVVFGWFYSQALPVRFRSGDALGAPSGASSASNSRPDDKPVGVTVAVQPFENRTGDAAFDSLALDAAEAAKNALRTVNLTHIAEPGASADWALYAVLSKHERRLRLTGQLRREGGPAEPAFEVETGELDRQTLLDGVQGRAAAEGRLLAAAEERRLRMEGCLGAAHEPLQAYYRLIGPRARGTHVDAGLPLIETAIRSDNRCAPAHVERARLLSLRGSRTRSETDLNEADASLKTALNSSPGDVDALAFRCQLAVFQLNFTEIPADADIAAAEQSCLEALRASPSSAAVRVFLARLYDRRCDDERAMKILEEAVSLDRAVAGSALAHLAELTLQNGRLYVAERASAELLGLQEEEKRLGSASLSRRAGYDPVENAHFIHAEVLLGLGRDAEAATALRAELRDIGAASTHALVEFAALVGLDSIESRAGKTVRPEDRARRTSLEAELNNMVKADSSAAVQVGGALLWIDSEAAIYWLNRAAPPARSCTAAISQAVMFGVSGRRDKARALLNTCTPQTETERACLVWGTRRAGL